MLILHINEEIVPKSCMEENNSCSWPHKIGIKTSVLFFVVRKKNKSLTDLNP